MTVKKIVIIIVAAIISLGSGLGTSYIYKKNVWDVDILKKEFALIETTNFDLSVYSETEKKEFDKLIETRQQLFEKKDIEGLKQNTVLFKELDTRVKKRVEAMKKEEAQQYETRKQQVETVQISEGAIEDEVLQFDTKRAEILRAIEEKQPLATIDQGIEALNQLNIAIAVNAADRAAAEQRQSQPTYVTDNSVSTPEPTEETVGETPEPEPTPETPATPDEGEQAPIEVTAGAATDPSTES